MNVLIWIVVTMFIPELVHGESNPYKEALLARPWESEQDYVTVRPGAHMFYWLYYADCTRVGASCKPLIIWIPGGPGNAASGIANFAEIGPLTMNMEPRNHTWVKRRNILLLDPVGAGFSYVRNNSTLPKTDQEVADGLFIIINEFFKQHKEFRETSTYLFGQGYGGKVCPIVAYYLHEAIEKKHLKMKLKGIGIGGGWVNPMESILMRPLFLYNMGMIDLNAYLDISVLVDKVTYYCNNENYIQGLHSANDVSRALKQKTGGAMNYNNIYQTSPNPELLLLQSKINTYVKPTLSHVVDQTLEWNYRSQNSFISLIKTYVVPSTKFLEMLLNESKLKVAVYNGNLDALTPVAGASNWVHKLKWNGSEEFKRATRHQIRGMNNGFYKEAKQLSFWWVFGAGHWVPEDNPEAMKHILDYVTSRHV